VEQLRNTGIINSTTRLHLVGSFYEIYITMHGSMNIKTEIMFRDYVASHASIYTEKLVFVTN
jgi:hypothetical protein